MQYLKRGAILPDLMHSGIPQQYLWECHAILLGNAMQYCRDAINRVSTLPDKRLSLIPLTQTFAAKALFYIAPFFLSGFGNGLFFHLWPIGN